MFYTYNNLEQSAILYVKIKPNSNENGIDRAILWQDKWVLVIKIKSIPQDGKANAELVKFLGAKFKIPTASITIISGHVNKLKKIKIENLSSEHLQFQLKYLYKKK